MTNGTRGAVRERQVSVLLAGEGWVVYRAAGSHGNADLVALRAGDRPRLVQVKSSAAGPFSHFSPRERLALAREADRAGAEAWLCWWPSRRAPRWFDPSQWPGSTLKAT